MPLSERFELRLEEETLRAIDYWRSQHEGHPSRSEAIRQLIDRGLSGRGEKLRFSAGERLATLLLCDVLKALPRKSDREFDPDEVKEIVAGGHLWALKSKYSWAFNREMDDPIVVDEVWEILEMWEQLEEGLAALKSAEKERFSKEAKVTAGTPRFEGFDANNDEHYRLARFIVKHLEQFEKFESRLNSRTRASLPAYRRMLAVFRTIEPTGRNLSADQLIEVFKARLEVRLGRLDRP